MNITPKVGARYVMRNGDETPPLRRAFGMETGVAGASITQGWHTTYTVWNDRGMCVCGSTVFNSDIRQFDLVAPIEEEEPAPKPASRLLPWIIAGLVAAVVLHMLVTRRASGQEMIPGCAYHSPVTGQDIASCIETHADRSGVGFIPSGTWITTEKKGDKVCRLAQTVYYRMPNPGVGFCTDWQTPYRPLMRGQQFPTWEGWVRFAPSLQFHTEQGWKP